MFVKIYTGVYVWLYVCLYVCVDIRVELAVYTYAGACYEGKGGEIDASNRKGGVDGWKEGKKIKVKSFNNEAVQSSTRCAIQSEKIN